MTSAHEAHQQDRVTRGRDLMAGEIECYLADLQTPIRHGRAYVGDEIASMLYRDGVRARDSQTDALLAVLAEADVHSPEDLTRWVEFLQGEARMDPFQEALVDVKRRCARIGWTFSLMSTPSFVSDTRQNVTAHADGKNRGVKVSGDDETSVLVQLLALMPEEKA